MCPILVPAPDGRKPNIIYLKYEQLTLTADMVIASLQTTLMMALECSCHSAWFGFLVFKATDRLVCLLLERQIYRQRCHVACVLLSPAFNLPSVMYG